MFYLQYNQGMRVLFERVDNLREKRGWSWGQLQIQAQQYRPGLSRSSLYEVLRGERSPTLEMVGAIAHALGTTIAYLIGETDNPAPDLDAGQPLPEIVNWSARLRALPADQRALTIRAMELVLAAVEGRDEEP